MTHLLQISKILLWKHKKRLPQILNSKAISEQIIKVIKEKLNQEPNTNVNVKCNTSLADTLINNKSHIITDLEKNYKSKITFIFDYKFSLHETIVDLVKSNDINLKEDIKIIKTKKKIIRKKTKIKKKIVKKNINKENQIDKNFKNKDEIINNDIDSDSNQNQNFESNDVKNEEEEKTGWWS